VKPRVAVTRAALVAQDALEEVVARASSQRDAVARIRLRDDVAKVVSVGADQLHARARAVAADSGALARDVAELPAACA
jgi:hypothetical protein